jgi:hypothetical protein
MCALTAQNSYSSFLFAPRFFTNSTSGTKIEIRFAANYTRLLLTVLLRAKIKRENLRFSLH